MASVWADNPGSLEAATITVRDVEAARRGDRNAYARLVQRHQRVVASITLAITTDLGASEDAAQEAFLAGWRDLSRLEDPESFGPWICQIARNRAHDVVRNRKRIDPAAPETLDAAAAPDPDALEALVHAETERLISGALLALPEDSREVMVLYYREGQSIAQVAAVLGVSEDVVKKRLSRARERVRKSVETALGAALLATIPTANLFVEAIAEIGTASPLSSLSPPKSWPGLGPLASLASGSAKVALLGVAAFIAMQAMQQRTPMQVFFGTPPAVRTVTVSKPAPPRIRSSLNWPKGVDGTLTLTYATETRTIPIVNGAFNAELPAGACTATITLDGYPSPPPRKLTIREGEIHELRLEHVKKTHPGDEGEATVRWE